MKKGSFGTVKLPEHFKGNLKDQKEYHSKRPERVASRTEAKALHGETKKTNELE